MTIFFDSEHGRITADAVACVSGTGNRLLSVRVALALILLAAVGLKSHELMTTPAAALPTPWGWSVALVQFEMGVACWILLAPSPRWAWWGALLTFGLFAIAAAAKWASGAADCGCFGRLTTRPWQSLLVDLMALTALVVARPRILPLPPDESRGERPPPRRLAPFFPFLLTWLLLALPFTATLAAFRPIATSALGLIAGSGNVMVLEPQKWLGSRWPLLDYIDRGPELSSGRWQIVLYHHDCPKCRALLAQLAATPSSLPLPLAEGQSEGNRLMLIEVPPFEEPQNQTFSVNAVRAKLADSREWYGPLPIQALLVNGRVEEVTSGR